MTRVELLLRCVCQAEAVGLTPDEWVDLCSCADDQTETTNEESRHAVDA